MRDPFGIASHPAVDRNGSARLADKREISWRAVMAGSLLKGTKNYNNAFSVYPE